MIKETTKTVYTTTDGTEFTNKNKAVEYEKTYLEIKEIAKSLKRVKEICRNCDSCTECPLKRFFPDYTSKLDKIVPLVIRITRVMRGVISKSKSFVKELTTPMGWFSCKLFGPLRDHHIIKRKNF